MKTPKNFMKSERPSANSTAAKTVNPLKLPPWLRRRSRCSGAKSKACVECATKKVLATLGRIYSRLKRSEEAKQPVDYETLPTKHGAKASEAKVMRCVYDWERIK